MTERQRDREGGGGQAERRSTTHKTLSARTRCHTCLVACALHRHIIFRQATALAWVPCSAAKRLAHVARAPGPPATVLVLCSSAAGTTWRATTPAQSSQSTWQQTALTRPGSYAASLPTKSASRQAPAVLLLVVGAVLVLLLVVELEAVLVLLLLVVETAAPR